MVGQALERCAARRRSHRSRLGRSLLEVVVVRTAGGLNRRSGDLVPPPWEGVDSRTERH